MSESVTRELVEEVRKAVRARLDSELQEARKRIAAGEDLETITKALQDFAEAAQALDARLSSLLSASGGQSVSSPVERVTPLRGRGRRNPDLIPMSELAPPVAKAILGTPEGGIFTIKGVCRSVYAVLRHRLSDADLAGRSWMNRISVFVNYLTRWGVVKRVGRGLYQVSDDPEKRTILEMIRDGRVQYYLTPHPPESPGCAA